MNVDQQQVEASLRINALVNSIANQRNTAYTLLAKAEAEQEVLNSRIDSLLKRIAELQGTVTELRAERDSLLEAPPTGFDIQDKD